jgi:hypothetical protein
MGFRKWKLEAMILHYGRPSAKFGLGWLRGLAGRLAMAQEWSFGRITGWNLEGFGPLLQHPFEDAMVDCQDCTVADMVGSNNQWLWGSFAHFLPVQVLMIMESHPPPTVDLTDDSVFWRHSTNGSFSIHSAYDSQVSNVHQKHSLTPLWKLIWKWKGPKRIKSTFRWTVSHNGEMTNENRVRRHIAEDPFCNHSGRGGIFSTCVEWLCSCT